ncbi:MAG: glutamine-hydrolyzing GMP synthase [Clostridia bacterium]|nr:glutamine-hydrolyzing GMP synthase [Clostridia bacterium]
MARDMIAILDFGSSDNSGIARAVRKAGVYSEIVAHDITLDELKKMNGLKGLIYNGGSNRAYEGQRLIADPEVLSCDLPKLAVGCEFTVSGVNASSWNGREREIIDSFIDEAQITRNWSMEGFIEDQISALREQIGDKKVLLALSGGVDSSVVAALLLRAIGNQLTCVHVNHGLLRKGEPEQVVRVFKEEMGANLIYVDAVDRFLNKLEGVSDPEQKRKIIGAEFIRVFEEEARKLDDISFLGQGTIYPDILESGTKTARNIKSHHNVGGLPDDLKFELVEPLKQLFKDEVRAVGEALGLPHSMVYRQPFPGPGLGVRCVGAITRERLEQVRESDAILREEFAKAGLDQTVWQYFTVVPDIRSTGVRNHARCWERPVILRAVNTQDAITASIEEIPYAILAKIVSRIVNEVPGVNRVLYDLSPKPVATIEWE